MKTAIYIEDGVIQLVLTPDNEWEKKALASFEDKALSTRIFVGEFYDCRGGWVRQRGWTPMGGAGSERSLILKTYETDGTEPTAEQVS